jgi:hypothetical protein
MAPPGVKPSAPLRPKNTSSTPRPTNPEDTRGLKSVMRVTPRLYARTTLRRRLRILSLAPDRACMATCPRCRGHLTDHHRCPRRPAKVAAELTLAAIAGGLLALLVLALIDPGGQLTHIDLAAVAVGMFGGVGLDRLLRG